MTVLSITLRLKLRKKNPIYILFKPNLYQIIFMLYQIS